MSDAIAQAVRYMSGFARGPGGPPWTRPCAWPLPDARFTLLHVTSAEAPDVARGAYAGLFGRGARDPAPRLAQEAAISAARLLQAAARRARECDQLELEGRAERVVVAASAQADLLIVARDGDRAAGPSLGRATRFVVDHAACPVLLVWPGSAPGIGSIPAATSSFPSGPLNRETRTRGLIVNLELTLRWST